MENHIVSDKRLVGYQFCKRCGLVYLKNEISRAAIKYGCDHEQHPEFQKIEKRIRQEVREKTIQ